jgi:hypothetical protein
LLKIVRSQKKVFYCPPKLQLYGPPYIQGVDTTGIQIDLDKSIDHVEPKNSYYLSNFWHTGQHCKVECSGKRLMVCWKIWGFRNSLPYKRHVKFHEAPHTVAQLYGLPRGIIRNPQIFQQTISLFPEHSTFLGPQMANIVNDLPKKVF